MTYFLLPHTVSNSIYEQSTASMNISLHEYLNTMNQDEHVIKFGSYIPKTIRFFIMAELLQLHKIQVTKSLHIGTASCIEYLNYIGNDNSVYIDDVTEETFSLIVDDTGNHEMSPIQKHQCIGGTYIAKIPDSTSSEAIQCLYKLCASYKMVYLCKPEAECPTTKTKYVIAINFFRIPENGNLRIPYYFRTKLDDMNSVFGQTQLDYLRSDEIYDQKKIDWCLRYSIPI